MINETFNAVKKRYDELTAEREKYTARWNEVAKYVGIRVDPQNFWKEQEGNKSADLDRYTEDPTATLAVQQSADYLKGIMWGTGDNAFSLVPSDEVLGQVTAEEVKDWYDYASCQVLAQMNEAKAGLNSHLNAYFYDQQAFGTSGVGAFPNSDDSQDNVLVFRSYGVDTLCIDEGKSGLVEVIYNTYNWRVNRIVQEFCNDENGFNQAMFDRLPAKIKADYNAKNFNNVYRVIHGVMPRAEYVKGALGKKGCKYVGYWFTQDSQDFFKEEDYKELPIAVARAIKLRGEIYGRASGTMLISSIRCVNEAVANAMNAMAKMVNPPIGILNTALFGDDVVDTSENGLTVLNAAKLQGNQPIWPMIDVGDPSALVQWLVPYLNEKIATAFKIDILLDFSSQSDMTATESLQRFSIRGRSISGMILAQKVELFEPLIARCVAICMDKGICGVAPDDEQAVAEMAERGLAERVIPEAVMECINSGKRWYKIHFNNEVEKLGKTDKVDDLIKLINVITAMAALYPQIVEAIDWYGLLADVTKALGASDNLISANEFKQIIQMQAQQQAMAMQAQAGEMDARANRDNALALQEMSKGMQQ